MKQIAFLSICLLFAFPAYSQNASNPVQVTSNLIPPYSLYLSDYSDASQNKWNIQLLLKDFTQTNYQAKLRITIEGAGIRLRTRKGYSAGPIRLDPGIPYQVDATDLSQYLNIQNMEVSGINRNQLASTQKLPEGFYQFKIEVLDYNRNNRVSNTGTSMAWLVLNDPPLLNLPFEEKLRIQDPQQVQFQWTPRHTSSPNSAFETEYIFRLWEIWPEGRDPNEVARTTQPLFERTIMTTSYFYGLNDAMLIPGRSYAWQVKAINLNGRDLFKNQGRSEVRWFKYGDECLPITNLGAEALGTDRIRITWEGKWNHNQYVAQIREKGEEGWINYGTNIETQVVYDLKASTEYQIRVLPSCGAIEGTAENTLTLVTLEQEPNDMNCGAEPDLPTIENREPIAQLSPGDRITAAGFTVILTEVIKTGNTYTGMGLIEVPLFNSARVEAVLNNIKVNTDKQLIGGTVESTLNPNGPFILDTDIDEELSEEGGNGDNNNDDEEEIDDLPETDVDIEGEIADVEYEEEEGTITVIDTEGNTTDIDPETADENGDGNVVIEDGKGNVWVVDEGGEVSGPHQSNPDTITEDTPIDFMVRFKESKNQQYGFDFKQHEALSSEYEQIQINGENYSIPWKSIKIGSTDPVTAEIIGKPEFPEMIGFRNFSSNLASSPTESQKEKTVTLQITTEEEEITAYVLQESTNEEGETEEESIAVGKLKVKQYEQIRKKIVLVQVNDADIPAPSLLQDELNGIYGPAVVEWDVSATEPYEVSEEQLETLDEGESGMFASFPQNMRQFNRKFKRSIDFDRDAYYLFVIEGNYSDKAGIMPFKRQFGYIFKDNVDNINKTLAHELAHGAFRLRHTFSEEGFIANMNSTDNLMDYRPDGTDLYKHQWDLVHDPESMIGWFEDDEESASGVEVDGEKVLEIINKIRSANRDEEESIEVDLTEYGDMAALKGTINFSGTSVRMVLVTLLDSNDENIIDASTSQNEDDNEGFGEEGEFLRFKFLRLSGLESSVRLLIDKENEQIVSDYLFGPIYPINSEQVQDIFPNTDAERIDSVVNLINTYSNEFELTNSNRMSHFLAQIGAETEGLNDLREDANYTAENIYDVFLGVTRISLDGGTTYKYCDLIQGYDCLDLNSCPDNYNGPNRCGDELDFYYPTDNNGITGYEIWVENEYSVKEDYVADESLFDYVYSCRMENDHKSSNDGSTYLGKGFIHITGKRRYRLISEAWNEKYPNDLKYFHEDDINLLETDLEIAMKASLIFWEMNGLNETADGGINNETILNVTRGVNGGTNGLNLRSLYTTNANDVFNN